MKNIHLLPTDKPSRLIYNDANQLCYRSNKSYKNDRKWMHRKKFNIYITSNEEIKEGEKCITFGSDKCKGQLDTFQSNVMYSRKPQKIILTTDQDLIKDGVQTIPDEFLEWFVKNPSCEEVKVELHEVSFVITDNIYKIIIPQEEPKCFDCKGVIKDGICFCNREEPKQETLTYTEAVKKEERIFNSIMMKQETLEEAGKDYIENTMKFSFDSLDTKTQANRMLKCVEFGANYQAERMYSETEVLELLRKSHFVEQNIEEWFEQFKKK
jgi:hypothetical protein